jgi:hypothetical protein
MVSESYDISTSDPTMVKIRSKDTYQLKKPIFWTILSIIVAIFIVLLVLTIYFGVRQKRTIADRTSINPLMATTNKPTETTTFSPPFERIPTNLKQEIYRLTISPNLTSETFTGLCIFFFELFKKIVSLRYTLLYIYMSGNNE